MELFLVLVIALLLLKPDDVQQIIKIIARLFAWKRHYQQRSQELFKIIEQKLSAKQDD
jgi:hypothetical protein